jgi:hypothetical protein
LQKCARLAYLVSLSGENTSIEEEVMKGRYWSFAGEDDVKPIS